MPSVTRNRHLVRSELGSTRVKPPFSLLSHFPVQEFLSLREALTDIRHTHLSIFLIERYITHVGSRDHDGYSFAGRAHFRGRKRSLVGIDVRKSMAWFERTDLNSFKGAYVPSTFSESYAACSSKSITSLAQ